MRYSYVSICMGCIDLIILLLAFRFALELPNTWLAVAIFVSCVATIITVFFPTSIQLVVFPVFLFIDCRMLFALYATRMPADSLSVVSLGAIYTTAIGTALHLVAVPILLALLLYHLLSNRNRDRV